MNNINRLMLRAVAFAFFVGLVGCSHSPQRNASVVTEHLTPLETSGLRFWDEHTSKVDHYDFTTELTLLIADKSHDDQIHHLALSGGGVNGAFSAGILNAWTQKGDRPVFDVVTGVSTGAIVSIFAYLGSEYDEDLKHYYTQTTVEEMFQRRSLFKLVTKRSVVDTSGFERKVREAISQDMIKQLAAERQKGRILLIATTNLDNEKMALWDIGRIAQVGTTDAQTLIQDLIIASSSIPGAFPAKLIQFPHQGEVLDEMHVDGGVSRQVFLVPQWMQNRMQVSELKQTVYVIRNGSLKPSFHPVNSNISSVSAQSLSTLTRRQGASDVEYIYHYSQANNLSFNLAHIDDDFNKTGLDPMSLEYMQAVYEYGFHNLYNDALWLNTPPSIAIEGNYLSF